MRNNSNNQRFLFVERQVDTKNRKEHKWKQWQNNKKKNLKNTKPTTQERNTKLKQPLITPGSKQQKRKRQKTNKTQKKKKIQIELDNKSKKNKTTLTRSIKQTTKLNKTTTSDSNISNFIQKG